MKRILSSAAILFLLVLAAGCQLFSRPDETIGQNIPPLSTLLPSTKIADTLTPTRDVPYARAWIAFIRDNNIWLVHPGGDGLHPITDHPRVERAGDPQVAALDWSPDGKHLAFTYGAEGVFSLQLYDLETDETSLLVARTAGAFDWSSDSLQIIYDTPIETTSAPYKNQGLWIVKLEDVTKRRVFETEEYQHGPLNPRWSFDERYVLASSTSGDAFDRTVAGLTTSSVIHLVNTIERIEMCEWAPDEGVLACVRDVSGADQKTHPVVTLLDTTGNILNDIALPLDWTSASLHWSPDGSRMAVGYKSEGSKRGTVLLSLGTETIQPLSSSGSSNWSPDGKWLLVWDEQTGQGPASQISIVSAESGDSVPLAEGTDAAWQWSQEPVESKPRSVPIEPLYATQSVSTQLDLAISVKDTRKGDILLIHTADEDYQMGPLAKGIYSIGPNGVFFVYVTYGGEVLAARFGERGFDLVGRIKEFSTIRRGGIPRLMMIFFGFHPYTLQVIDLDTEEKQDFFIPRYISLPE